MTGASNNKYIIRQFKSSTCLSNKCQVSKALKQQIDRIILMLNVAILNRALTMLVLTLFCLFLINVKNNKKEKKRKKKKKKESSVLTVSIDSFIAILLVNIQRETK